MKKCIHAVMLLLGGLTLALSTSVAPAHAGVLPFLGQEHDQKPNAINSNSTDQSAYSDATTKQANFNVPISVLSFASNNGDVKQSNDAGTEANAENGNATYQDAAGQNGGNDGRDQAGSNDNRTKQHAGADAFTKQVNVNAPISILSYGSNNGNVDQSNRAYTNANAENNNATAQRSGEQEHSPKHDGAKQRDCHKRDGQDQKGRDQKDRDQKGHDQREAGSNSNDTHQRANAEAFTKQKNFNTPVSILSFAANNGNVDQSNRAYTDANAQNGNWTFQKSDGNGPTPSAKDYGHDRNDNSKDGGKEFKSPTNENHTDQHAYAKAKTEQKNVNAPFSFLSFAANNGNVRQHNNAGTQAFAGNGNWTGQSAGSVLG